jgi:putative lipoprotein
MTSLQRPGIRPIVGAGLFGVALTVGVVTAMAQTPAAKPAAATAAPAVTLPANYACTGNEPSWKLEIIGGSAALTQMSGTAPEERKYKGELEKVPTAKVPFVVWRGRLDAGLREMVAFVSQEACKDTMSAEGPAGGESPFTARVSLPQGAVRTGCCKPIGPDAAWAAPAVAAPAIGRVTGTVTYRQRIALTPEAVLRIALVDASRADAAAAPISEITLPRPGQVPIAFELPYPTARINAKRNYAVRATISEGDQVVMASTQSYLVITSDRPTKVDIVVSAPKPAP